MLGVASSAAKVSLGFHLHPSVVLVVGAVATFFWWAFTRLGPSVAPPGELAYSRRQRNWVIAGVVATFVFSFWPLHDISEKYLFLSHMLQHTVFTLVAPACFLLGSPDWLWRWALRRRPFAASVRFLSRPLVALLVFNGLIAVTHWPKVVERSLHNEWFHFLLHAVLFASATLMWIPVINRTELLPRLKTPTKMMYLFAQSIVPTVPASFLTFSKTPLYPTYGRAPRLIHGLDAVGDQQIAAAIMKIGAGGLLWAIVGYLFISWQRDTRNGVSDDNILATGTSRVRIAGMTVDGGRVAAFADGGSVAAHADNTRAEDSEVLTWEHVRAEFDRLDAETSET